jgi:hypothetical protein
MREWRHTLLLDRQSGHPFIHSRPQWRFSWLAIRTYSLIPYHDISYLYILSHFIQLVRIITSDYDKQE